MTWAVRGCSGYGAAAGCIFAGVAWGAAWWFISREPGGERLRRYSSGWIILAVTVGMGLSGARGWMQWPSFFEGRLNTNYAAGEWVPISRTYGFVWLFIAGAPWAGVGACMLAWCGSLRETRAWHWAVRIACGVGGAFLARYLCQEYPQYFLPLYDSLEAQYKDLEHNPTLRRMINDTRSAVLHMGFFLGLLTYEIGRREWKNVTLISVVGFANGVGWALCQNWKWAAPLWPDAGFNWWRCWESSGGISIGVANGLAYYLTNRKMGPQELAAVQSRRAISGPNVEWLAVFLGMTSLVGFLLFEVAEIWGLMFVSPIALFGLAYYLRRRDAYYQQPSGESASEGDPNIERFGLYVGLLFGLGLSIRSGVKGWFNIYLGNEEYWSGVLWKICGPAMLLMFLLICWQAIARPLPRNTRGDRFPRAYGLMWLVLIVQNVLAQLITGPLTQWNEMAFSIYYVLLFAITAVIVIHYEFRRSSNEQLARLSAR